MVLRVVFRGQAIPLDRVREDHRRSGVVDGGEGLTDRLQIVAAQIADRRLQRVVLR